MALKQKGKTVSTHIPHGIAEILIKRAQNMNWTVSKYVGYILQDWHARGCPAINNIDEALNAKNAAAENAPSKTAIAKGASKKRKKP